MFKSSKISPSLGKFARRAVKAARRVLCLQRPKLGADSTCPPMFPVPKAEVPVPAVPSTTCTALIPYQPLTFKFTSAATVRLTVIVPPLPQIRVLIYCDVVLIKMVRDYYLHVRAIQSKALILWTPRRFPWDAAASPAATAVVMETGESLPQLLSPSRYVMERPTSPLCIERYYSGQQRALPAPLLEFYPDEVIIETLLEDEVFPMPLVQPDSPSRVFSGGSEGILLQLRVKRG